MRIAKVQTSLTKDSSVGLLSLNLLEWESKSPDKHPQLREKWLDDDPAVKGMAKALTDARILEVLDLKDGLSIRSFSYVGRVRLGGITVTVRPKISVVTLLNFLKYGYSLRNIPRYFPVKFDAQPKTFQDLLISQLAAEASELLAKGLHRKYVRTEEDLASPKGRINLRKIVRDGGTVRATLPCTYYPRLEDCLVNQVLLAGLHLAATITTDLALRVDLRRLISWLQLGVSPTTLDGGVFRKLRAENNRLVAAYEPSITIIHLLLRSLGVSFEDNEPSVRIPGFLFDMNRLFQKIISRFINENLRGYTVRDEHILQDTFSYAPMYNPQRRRAPRPRPDFVVLKGSRPVSVLDAKYRDLWTNELPASMLYQLSVYAVSQEHVRCAVILYPTMNTGATEARIDIHDPVSGGRNAQVILRPINIVQLEHLISLPPNGPSARERASYADWLAFGRA